MIISDDKTKNIALTENLYDAGCNEEEIACFIKMNTQGDRKGQLQLLAKHRKKLLGDVHAGEKKISCLDYFVHKIRNNDQERQNKNSVR